MKFPFPFKSSEIPITTAAAAVPSWRWPICATNPKTLSFRATTGDNNIYKTISEDDDRNSSELANATPDESLPDYQESAVISGVRSDRLFFEPGATSSIVEEAKEESVAMVVVMESTNPFVDFRDSMEEMVEGGGVRDLEELLEWYLRVNDESNHGCIVGAFLDLLLHRNSSSSSSSSSPAPSFASPLSFSSSSVMDRPCFISSP